jgi:MTH538 TIR-like domain (DUF1863)
MALTIRNMDTVFVSFDYENDKHYKYLLEAWHANPRFKFVFEDGTPTEIDSNNVGRIKAALTSKVKDATHTLVIVGQYANQRHAKSYLIGYKNWINFEIHQSAQERKRIAVVRLNRSYELPEELKNAQYSLVEGFSEANVTEALRTAPYQYSRYAL